MQAIAVEATRGMIGGLLWLALLHGLWIGLAAAGGVALAFQAGRALSHQSRRATLLAALVLVAVGPPALSALQYLADARRPEGVPAGAEAAVVASAAPPGAGGPAAAITPAQARPEEDFITASLNHHLSLGMDHLGQIAKAARPFGLVVWSLTVMGLSAVLILGARGLSRLRREAFPASPFAQKRAHKLARLLRLRRVPAIRVHPTLVEPCLCGVFRPVVLLPARWLASASVESLDAVLAHELAHAKRFDHLVNLAQRGLEVLLFFHPGVHWLSRALRRQCERCADTLAVRLTGDPLTLARTLESMARSRAGAPTSRSLGAAFGGESTSLLPRIQELIGMTPICSRLPAWPFVALPLAAAVAFVAASIRFAQDEPSTSSTAPSSTVAVLQSAKPYVLYARRATDDEMRQISYRVQLIDVEERNWPDHFQGRLAPCGPELEERGWLLFDGAWTDLIVPFTTYLTATIHQAPTVTTFEDDGAILVWPREERGVNLAAFHDDRWGWHQSPPQGFGFEGYPRIDLRGGFSSRAFGCRSICTPRCRSATRTNRPAPQRPAGPMNPRRPSRSVTKTRAIFRRVPAC